MRALVTGGAGFIGSHLADALLARGYDVRILDSLDPQVHARLQPAGADGVARPDYLTSDAELMVGDIRDRATVVTALRDVDVIFHEAGVVGVGQSMYEIERYVDVNTRGTATLLDVLVNERNQVRKLVVASSMSVYGDGAYRCAQCGPVSPASRTAARLAAHDWEMRCPQCDQPVTPVPTTESKALMPNSIYAISKFDQERMCLCVGKAYGIPTTALRYFNAYGARQALSNPYTGVAAIFCARLLTGHAPVIYEDGLQSRDYVHVSDLVQANLLAADSDKADYEVFNVGTGRSLSVLDMALFLCREFGRDVTPDMVGQYRSGDIRHCYADIGKAQELLGYEPRVSFEVGAGGLLQWVKQQTAVTDSFSQAHAELQSRGLSR